MKKNNVFLTGLIFAVACCRGNSEKSNYLRWFLPGRYANWPHKPFRCRGVLRGLVALALVLALLGGAVKLLVQHSAGRLVDYAETRATSYMLQADDLDQGCVMAEAFSLLLPGLREIRISPYRLEILFGFLTGMCAELKASEQELRYLRAVFNRNMTDAQDARILQKRYLHLAAIRQLKGYRNLVRVFPRKIGNGCPHFTRDSEEFYWLVGLMNGLQAVLNDLVSEGSADVPLDIGHRVGRGASCLDNEKWWGMPDAIRAALWINSLNTIPENVDPFAVLNRSVETGIRQGVRITEVIMARLYAGLGDTAKVRAIIRDSASAEHDSVASDEFRFLDTLATAKLLAISDAMWTEATGKRTPVGGFGTFWDDRHDGKDSIDISDIL